MFKSLRVKPLIIKLNEIQFALEFDEKYVDADNKISGGLQTIILDSMMGMVVFTSMKKIQPIATLNLRTDFFSKAAVGSRAICSANCTKVNEKIAHVTGEICDESSKNLIARGTGTFMMDTRSLPDRP